MGLEHHANGRESQESDWKGYWKDIEQDGKSLKILSSEICLCSGDTSGLLYNEIWGVVFISKFTQAMVKIMEWSTKKLESREANQDTTTVSQMRGKGKDLN